MNSVMSDELEGKRMEAENMMKEAVKKQFGRQARLYTTSSVHAQSPDLAELVELVEPKPEFLVLDIATGAGHTAFALAPYVRKVIASDLTFPMLKEAQGSAGNRSLSNVIAFATDAEYLAFKNETFDAVTCRVACHHFSNIRRAVHEMARVLKLQGDLVIVDNNVPDDEELDRFVNAFEKLRDPSHARCYTPTEWKSFLDEVGIAVDYCELSKMTLPFDLWIRNAGVPPDREEILKTRLLTSGDRILTHMNVIQKDDQPISFDLDRIIIHGVKR